MGELILEQLMEHNHLMELIGAFLTGVVGPILYLIINKVIHNKQKVLTKFILDL
jgi:hypothetical protein